MPNKSSPHGGFISEGTISHGTLRTQDLLRSFAEELNRVLPFNSQNRVFEARELANRIDTLCGASNADFYNADIVISELMDSLDTIAHREGFYFGAHPGDDADFGYWSPEE